MPAFTIYDTSTGAIVATTEAGSLAEAESNATASQAVIEGYYAPNAFTIKNGAAVAGAPPRATPPLGQLAAALVFQASAACDAITAQVATTETRIPAYANASAWVMSAGGAPTVDPYKTAFAGFAAAMGTTPTDLADVFETFAVASVNLVTALTTLDAAASAALSAEGPPASLASPLAAFESALADEVAELNAALKAAGVAVTLATPAAIVITGINA